MTCGDCHYADLSLVDDIDGEGPGALLLCRRYPPTPIAVDDGGGSFWPPVDEQEWCGEHTPREDHP